MSLEALSAGTGSYPTGSFRVVIQDSSGSELDKFFPPDDISIVSATHRAGPLADGTYTVSGQFRRVYGQQTVRVQAGQLFAQALSGGRGQVGPTGPVGSFGPTGAGYTGLQGIQGATGIQGPTGVLGQTGLRGATGVRGTTGICGKTGIQGTTGLVGPTGFAVHRPVPSAYVTIDGTYTTNTSTWADIPGLTTTITVDVPGSRVYSSMAVQSDSSGTGSYPKGSFRILIDGTASPEMSRFVQDEDDIETSVVEFRSEPFNAGTFVVEGQFSKISGDRAFQVNRAQLYAQSLQGSAGSTGPTGSAGASGPQGLTGLQGPRGNTGPTGPIGSTGIQGIVGPTGPVGLTGIQGNTGIQGTTGIQGRTGVRGFTGLLGMTGLEGPTGIQGQTGVQGDTGIQGTTGVRGTTGIQGVTGIYGQTGLQGVTGIQGTTGVRGVTGIQGTTGIHGVTGIQGTTGIQGDQGITGLRGLVGFTGFQGPTGAQGDTGLQGPTGARGATGFTGIQGTTGIQGSTGIQGVTGVQGQTGIQGLRGFTGIQSPTGIQGVTGVQGETGIQGNTGIQGTTGIQGVTGVKGETGIQGRTGVRGETGLQGIQGINGQTGIQGIDGITGVPGTTGIQGVTGTIGQTGIQGISGNQGQTGIQGSTGAKGVEFGNQLPMGLPPDGTFSDGIFPWDASTMVTTGLDDINEILLAIAPAPPGILTGALVLSNTTKFSAILPTGLNSIWYQNGLVAGNTTTDYIIDNTYNLANANPSTSFKAGSTFGGDEGTVYHVEDGTNTFYRDMTSGTGTTGDIQITSLATYNTIWRKANAQINYTQSTEGFKRHAMRYQTLAVNQLTSDTLFWYDDVNPTPTVTLPTVVQNTLSSSRYLSGIRYYYTGDTFDMSSSVANIAKKAIRPTNPITYSMPGLSAVNVAISGASFAYDGTYNLGPTNVALNASNVYNINATLTVTGTKPAGNSASNTSTTQNRLINTYSASYSTNGSITMFDEGYRWQLSNDFSVIPGNYSNPTGDWTSSAALTNGNGQLYNSTWYYPAINYTSGYLPAQQVGSNYSTFSGDQVIVWAVNIGTAHSSMRIVFTGINYTDISADSSGNLNLDVRLPATTGWLDGGRPFGDGNGCQLGSSSGTTLNMSFGTFSSSGSNGMVFIRVTLRNTSAAKASQMIISGT